ncbi:MAG: ATP synthase F1 subunit epsilon [Parcubacteria group bacterium]|nr:ATP synthase F1 subunit epsilon [Parcubacteria group bacterium]
MSFTFEIVTPERVVSKETIASLTLPTVAGELTVLTGHVPMVTVLSTGVIETEKEDGTRDIMAVSGGFVEVMHEKTVILADTAERAEEIDEERLSRAKEEARKIMEDRRVDRTQFTNAAARLKRELARTKAIKRWRNLKNRVQSDRL